MFNIKIDTDINTIMGTSPTATLLAMITHSLCLPCWVGMRLCWSGLFIASGARQKNGDLHLRGSKYEPNMISTACVRPSLFQPGSGAYGSPCAPYCDEESSRTSLATSVSPTTLTSVPSATTIFLTTSAPSTTSIFQNPGKYEDMLTVSFATYFEALRHNNKGTSEGDKGLPEAPRGTLAYIFIIPHRRGCTRSPFTVLRRK